MGLRGSARGSHLRPSATFRTCSTRTRSSGHYLLDERPGPAWPLYCCLWALASNHVHVWKSLLERAGFTLADIPKEWDAFWSFWCDRVQPAVRKALGRDDIWGIGLPMSVDLIRQRQFFQFIHAYDADYVTRDGRLVIDDPEFGAADQGDRQLHGHLPQGLHAARSLTLGDTGDNKAFLAQTVVMTMNPTLSIPNALKGERPEDYYENAVTIEWPSRRLGRAATDRDQSHSRGGLQGRRHVATAKEFVRFLVGEGWLAHYLDFSAERMLPAMPKLLDAPFWLDPSDPHHMASAMQARRRSRMLTTT